MFELEPTDDVVRMAASGGGFKMEASLKSTDDLIRITTAAAGSRARILLTGLNERPLKELIRIAEAGRGCVVFADE